MRYLGVEVEDALNLAEQIDDYHRPKAVVQEIKVVRLLSVLRGEEEMKIKAPVVLLMLVWLTYSVSASGTESKTSFPKLPRQVVQTAKLLNLPSPKFKELGVVSFNQEKPTTVTYGHYRVDGVSSGLARISTAATQTFETQDLAYNLFLRGFLKEGKPLHHELRSKGYGVSAGGLIELFAYKNITMKTSNNLQYLPVGFSREMTVESKTTKLEIISGKLFPLEVGNKIVIRQTSENSMEKGKSRTSILELEVTNQITGYLLNNSELPGDVFEITLHSEGSRKGITPPSIFIFSSHIGWTVESHVGNIIEKAVGWD